MTDADLPVPATMGQVANPATGEVIDPRDVDDVARAWQEAADMLDALHAYRRALELVLLAHMDARAHHTLTAAGVKLRGDRKGDDPNYDVTILEELRDCDPPLPDEAWQRLVKWKTEAVVSKREADAIAASNESWRAVVDRARRSRPRRRRVARA